VLSARLDNVYYNSESLFKINYDKIINFIESDHNMVCCEVIISSLPKVNTKNKTIWKLNDIVIDDDYVDFKIKKICEEIPQYFECNNPVWYDKFINKVIKLLKCESQHRSFLQKQHLSSILSEIETLDLQNPNETMKSRKNILRKQLNDYYQEKLKGLEIRNKFVLKNFCQFPSKILLKETDKNNIKTTIDEIYFENEPIIDQAQISNHFHNQYNVMIGKKRAQHVGDYQFRIQQIEDENLVDVQNREFKYEEVYDVIKGMKHSSPGPNGLTLKFFKKYFPFFGKFYVNMINNLDNAIPNQLQDSMIKFIPKNKNKFKTINDYRPISITNYDYRILTKLMTNRLISYNSNIFINYQFCSIKDKKINDLIHLVRDLIIDAKHKKKDSLVLSLDQSKAFDKIDHDY
jgi:hypothetical protein